MVSAAKAFAKEPPREDLTDLKAVVRDFKWRYQDRALTDQVILYTFKAKSYKHAVRRACASRDKRGKMHNHQSRVREKDRQKLAKILLANEKKIRKRVDKAEAKGNYWRTGFDVLYEFIEAQEIKGIGPVTCYDVAVRLGAWLGVEPKSLYLHAGVRSGARALLGPDSVDGIDRLPLSILPSPLDRLRADDVEDIMCTYREVFEDWRRIGG